MDAQGMREYFDLVYNNLSSNISPGFLDDEISSFLNRAQEVLVEQYYEQYERREEARKNLSELVKEASLTVNPNNKNKGLESYSKSFKLPSDLLYIVYEKCFLEANPNKCLNHKAIDILPVTHDAYKIISNDPFRGYSKNIAMRLDTFDEGKQSEIIYKFGNVEKYFIRYIKRPSEIDITKNKNCELNESLHKTLVELAAKLAKQAFNGI